MHHLTRLAFHVCFALKIETPTSLLPCSTLAIAAEDSRGERD